MDYDTILSYCQEMEKSREELSAYVSEGGNDFSKIRAHLDKIRAYVRALKDDLPEEIKKKELTKLEQHAIFIERFSNKRDLIMVKRNVLALRPDIGNLASAIKRKAQQEGFLALDLSGLDVSESEYIQEANKCFSAGAYRAAIVMAGCSLESEMRRVFEQKFHKSSQGINFSSVIEAIEKAGGLSASESVLINLVRGFRNISGHPSGARFSKTDSQNILQLTLEQLKKRKLS